MTALQLLPPCQRAVLVLRDVLGFRAKEVAVMLDTREESVSSALGHARANPQSRLPAPGAPLPAANSQAERAIIEDLVTAYEAGGRYCHGVSAHRRRRDYCAACEGRICGAGYSATRVRGHLRPRPVLSFDSHPGERAPAFGVYVRDSAIGVLHANGMLVATLAGDRIRAMTRFDNSVIARFGLPRRLP